MRKLIFIDNDDASRAAEDVDYVKDRLEDSTNVGEGIYESVESVPDFRLMDSEDAAKLLYDPENCILTWSMYTASHHGSLFQLIKFLSSAYMYSVTGKIYIDCSGNVKKALEGVLEDDGKKCFSAMRAIESNYVLTFKDAKLFRVRVNLSGPRFDCLKLEALEDLKSLLEA